MKKPIAILTVVIMLTFKNCQNENQKAVSETPVSLVFNKVFIDNPCIAVVDNLKIAEEQDPPWKDPWQWIDAVRELYELWKSFNA